MGENFAADIPPELQGADDILTRYGRWATSYGARKIGRASGRERV